MPRHTVTEAATARRDRSRTGGGRARARTLRAAAAGLTAVAALGLLTACGGQDALKTSDGKPFHPFGKDSGGADEPLGPALTGPHTDQAATGGHAACDPAKVTLAAKPLPQPPGRVLIQVTNTSRTTCDLHGYPRLRTSDTAPAGTPHGSHTPRTPLTLTPGGTAYATVTPSSSATGHDIRTLSVGFTDRDGHALPGAPARIWLPKGVRVDDDTRVTYWQHDLTSALRP
ncbi:DUF4232 domain-containing protein [Streptomyces sp. NPDC018019]|uniref:DUF4232 domain-containing protein n=1 Tax=Streptomyces sp. NPDC018019 TaxID=3365030 RepID=UPI0037B221FF